MAYTTTSDIQAEFKSLDLSTSTALTTAKVSEFIVQQEAALNASISKKFATPVTTSADALSIMKMIATLMVKARCLDMLQVKTGDQKTDQGVTGDTLRKQAQEYITAILDGSMNLPGATLSETGGGVSYHRRVDSNGTTLIPTVSRDSDTW